MGLSVSAFASGFDRRLGRGWFGGDEQGAVGDGDFAVLAWVEAGGG